MSTQQQERRTDRDRQTPSEQSSRTETGVSDRLKRAGSLVVGTVLLLHGLRRQSVGGVVLAAVGAGVLARTLRGATESDRIDSSRLLSRRSTDEQQTAMSASRSITINESPDELYEAWRDPKTFTQIMGHFAEVTSTDEDRYHWTVHGPAGMYPSWETQIVESEPGELIRWESPPEATVPNSGSVRFRPAAGDRGTVVTLTLDFDPPGGPVGNSLLKRLNVVPETLAGHALGRFKSLVESGEIPTLEGNPSGRGQGDML
jgi:uncharacterized membrane protein